MTNLKLESWNLKPSLPPHVTPHLAPHFSAHNIKFTPKVARFSRGTSPYSLKPFALSPLKQAPFILNTFQKNTKS